jgi:hypothetical protein
MQFEEAERLRKAWGNKPCDHPTTEKEYMLGMDSGDKVCTTCGKAVFDCNGKRIEPDKK